LLNGMLGLIEQARGAAIRSVNVVLTSVFSERNIRQMRLFYLEWKSPQTVSAKSVSSPRFPPPWSHYVRLLHHDHDMIVEQYAQAVERDFAEMWRERFSWRVVALGCNVNGRDKPKPSGTAIDRHH
jgi:hypothetical protein